MERSSSLNHYIDRIIRAVTSLLFQSSDLGSWKVTVFDKDESVNAFALPGSYIGIYAGLLQVTENPAQLAAVVGHEIAHVTADHPNARLSTQYATQAGFQRVNAFIEEKSGEASNQIMSLLGLGSKVGIMLPFSRAQEKESDMLGL